MTHNEVYVLRRVTRDSLNTSGLGCRAYKVRQHSTLRLSLLVASSSYSSLEFSLIVPFQH